MSKKLTGARPPIPGEQPAAGYRFMRPNGGHVWHIVHESRNTSLCGHTPRHTATRMVRRARWLVLRNPEQGMPAYQHICRQCDALQAKVTA